MDDRDVAPLLADIADVVVPDLRGFGESDTHSAPAAQTYSVDAHVRSIVGLIDELGLAPAVLGGYDVGSRVAQGVAQSFRTGCARSSSRRRSRVPAHEYSHRMRCEISGIRPSIS
jgi:pimeloyl-ACP methyl ester carboxylesterase